MSSKYYVGAYIDFWQAACFRFRENNRFSFEFLVGNVIEVTYEPI